MIRGYTMHEHLEEVGIINMNGRIYDPVLGRFLQPDNYVQSQMDLQTFNRYAYAHNNPLRYTDPDGNNPMAVAVILGAALGGYQGYMIGQANGATGWSLFAYTMAEAGIGAGSALLGGAVAIGIGKTLPIAYAGLIGSGIGGAIGGSFSGASFATMSGKDAGEAAWKGAISGAAGGLFGAYIGGGGGSLMGGAVSGGISSALNNGGPEDIATSALISGAISFGSYNIQQAVAYGEYNNGSKPLGNLSKSGFRKISVATQRSFARGREVGGWILNNGDVGKLVYGGRAGISQMPNRPQNAVANFHTHPNDPYTVQYHSSTDLIGEKDVNYVIGWSKIYKNDPSTNPFPANYNSYSQQQLQQSIIPSLLSTYRNNLNPYPYYLLNFK
jgi:RHS repeat-associated protein